MKIIYDGWSLTYRPNSPAAIALLTLLEAHPPETWARLALPGPSYHPPGGTMQPLYAACPDSENGWLRWEQHRLPGLARDTGATIHSLTMGAALFKALPGIASPAGFVEAINTPAPPRHGGFTSRLRRALAVGGLRRLRAQLWPDDLPDPHDGLPLVRLPPAVHPLFTPEAEKLSKETVDELESLELPETYLLAHGPSNDFAWRPLLDAWSWAAGSIGGNYPLLAIGLNAAGGERLATAAAQYGLSGTLRPLPPLSLAALAEVYRRASALLHPWKSRPWGSPLRTAIACGRPVVAVASENAAATAGPAGYLVEPGEDYAAESRLLGAALISVIVDEDLGLSLAQAARLRSQTWADLRPLRRALAEFYSLPG